MMTVAVRGCSFHQGDRVVMVVLVCAQLKCWVCVCALGPGLKPNLRECISGQWCVHFLIGKRDIVDTVFHASRAT